MTVTMTTRDALEEAKGILEKLLQEKTIFLDELASNIKHFSLANADDMKRQGEYIDMSHIPVSDNHMKSLRLEITAINNALLRVEHMTYGVCPKCLNSISKERLAALPYAVYCMRCAH